MAPYDVSADAEMMLFAFAHNDAMFALHVPKAHIIAEGNIMCRRHTSFARRANITRKKHLLLQVLFSGDPWENRTPVTAVKGRCLSRLTNGPDIGSVDTSAKPNGSGSWT